MASSMPPIIKAFLAALLLIRSCTASELYHRHRMRRFHVKSHPEGLSTAAQHTLRKDLLSQCKLHWRDATLDHFDWGKPDGGVTTFRQRFFVCPNFWKGASTDDQKGPIFFYLGNEADVELYLNNTGLMWESAPDFGALLVFAEHRYYGQSIPYGINVRKHMRYLSAEQALADYAELIMEIKQHHNASDTPVIGFGGSYGGMLAAWMRMKYPHILDGAVAASAPIWSFFGEDPPYDSNSFAKGVTFDASESGGSEPECVPNVRRGWKLLIKLGSTSEGRGIIHKAMQLCPNVPLSSLDHVYQLRDWLSSAWDYMAMGNFPYPSSYILNGNGVLPPYPVRKACKHLAAADLTDQELLQAMAQAAGIFYNHSGQLQCFNPHQGVNPETDADADFWDYQYCTEMFMPFSRDGETDMFWRDDFNVSLAIESCRTQWGITPRPLWATTEWGGKRIRAASNIVFSNGLLDPWHGGGVLRDVSDSLPSMVIPEGAHHLDLMFANELDPQSVIDARQHERNLISQWINQARKPELHSSASQDTSMANKKPALTLEGRDTAFWRMRKRP